MIYIIETPYCPLMMEAETMDKAIQHCLDVGLEPSWLREASPSETKLHKVIHREMKDVIRAASKRKGVEL